MSTGIQSSSLIVNIPVRVAAGLTPVLQQQSAVETAEDIDKESDIRGAMKTPTLTYIVNIQSVRVRSDDVTPEEERQFLMSEVQLAKLLQNCNVCESACHPE